MSKSGLHSGSRRQSTAMAISSVPDPDPMPQPPEQPELEACCGSGCDPCIFDAYDLAVAVCRLALRAWRSRHPEAHERKD